MFSKQANFRGIAAKNEVVRHFSHALEIVALLTYVARLCMHVSPVPQ